ncbi:hypothetical protein ALO40_05098, partial [Pseudomonas syringae pv. viburni]
MMSIRHALIDQARCNMTTDANTDLSGAARFGHVLGCGLRRILNVERAFWSLFDRTGVPSVPSQ